MWLVVLSPSGPYCDTNANDHSHKQVELLGVITQNDIGSLSANRDSHSVDVNMSTILNTLFFQQYAIVGFVWPSSA